MEFFKHPNNRVFFFEELLLEVFFMWVPFHLYFILQ